MIISSLLAAFLVAIFWYAGLPVALGAHPIWANNVVLIGAFIGLIIFSLGYRSRGRKQNILYATILILSALVTWWGKTAFAASYAENALAGQAWYFGWIACVAAATTVIAAQTSNRLDR